MYSNLSKIRTFTDYFVCLIDPITKSQDLLFTIFEIKISIEHV